MVASKRAAPTQVGRMYEQRYNVALSRARDRMVLFRSVEPQDIANRDDMKLATIQFFRRMAASTSTGASSSSAVAQASLRSTGPGALASPRRKTSIAALFDEQTVEGQVLEFLDAHGRLLVACLNAVCHSPHRPTHGIFAHFSFLTEQGFLMMRRVPLRGRLLWWRIVENGRKIVAWWFALTVAMVKHWSVHE